jgi:bifunctional DNA-binding transcriptional regulator/antitoxin component of YhaV-PrlF toxin-antitoxin module
MIRLHDTVDLMKDELTTLTERGQVSVPASLRREMGLEPGQELIWRQLSPDEVHVQVVRRQKPRSRSSVIGCGKKLHEERGWPTRTDEWMKVLREGEEA